MKYNLTIFSLITCLLYITPVYAQHGEHDGEPTHEAASHEKHEQIKEPEFLKVAPLAKESSHEKQPLPEVLPQSNHKEYDSLDKNAQTYLNSGINLHNNQKFLEAIPFYKKAIDLSPTMLKAWYWMGKSYYHAGMMKEAFSTWNRATTLGEINKNEEISKKLKAYCLENRELPRYFSPTLPVWQLIMMDMSILSAMKVKY